MGKGEIEIILKKEGAKDIKVKCPRTIRQSSLVAAMPVGWGNPPFRVRPIDVKGAVAGYARFIGVFIACFFFLGSVMLGVIALAGMVVLNFVCTKNYFFNFIKKRLAEGYYPENEEQRGVLEAAGLFVGSSGASSPSFASAPSSPVQSNVANASNLISCPACGAQNEGDSKFCARCGKPMPLPVDPMEQVEKLGALMEKGLISKEEFDAQKSKLLGL